MGVHNTTAKKQNTDYFLDINDKVQISSVVKLITSWKREIKSSRQR